MSELKYKDTEKYYWCAWGRKIPVVGKMTAHFGKLEPGQRVTTGQKNLETYETEAELKAKVDSLMGSGYYEKKEGHDA